MTILEYQRKWRKNNRKKIKATRDRFKRRHPRAVIGYKQKDVAKYLIVQKRHDAKRRGLFFSLTAEDVSPLPATCPVFGTVLDYSFEKGGIAFDNSPSIDRIDSSLGYTPGNVRVISTAANRIKNNATLAQLKQLVQYVEAENAKRPDVEKVVSKNK